MIRLSITASKGSNINSTSLTLNTEKFHGI